MAETTARPSPCDALLDALGDSYESRKLINEFAHHLAVTVKEVEDNDTAPWKPSQIIDPLQHTRETWAAVTRCPRFAASLLSEPVCSHCGEPFAADSSVTTTPGGYSKSDYLWHVGRTACAEAAAAHHALVQSVGYIVPPTTPVVSPTPGSST